METGENTNLPQRSEYAPVEIASTPIPIYGQPRGFWKGVFVGMGSLASLEFGYVLIDRGFEVSGVKPNIIHACLYWFGAWCVISILIWAWVWGLARSRMITLTVGSLPIVALLLISAIIRPWVIEEYRAEHAPPDTIAVDTYKALTNLNAKVEKSLAPKPLKERVIGCLNSIDTNIVLQLKKGQTNFFGQLFQHQYLELQKLCEEPGASEFISITNSDGRWGPLGESISTHIYVKPLILN